MDRRGPFEPMPPLTAQDGDAALARAREAEERAEVHVRLNAALREVAEGRDRPLAAEHTARVIAETAQRRMAFLAAASLQLAASLDYGSTLQAIARLAVPEIADWCVVDLAELDEFGGTRLRRIAAAHADPAGEELVHQLQTRYASVEAGTKHTTLRVLESGRAWFDPVVSEVRLAAEARSADHLILLQALGFAGEIVVPLTARGRTLGVLTLVAASRQRSYTAGDLALAEELGQRCAVAVDNSRLYRETTEALRARDEFLSAAAHDLKTPLTGIKGGAQLLQRQALSESGLSQEQLLAGLSALDAAATRVARQVDQLLDITRLEAGQPLNLLLRTTDLVTVARRAVAEQQQSAPPHDIQVLAEEPSLVGNWDRARVERIVDNLIGNAIKYSPAGGEIVLRLSREVDGARLWAVLVVGDRGIGIPEADLNQIFRRFRRGSNVPESISGSGIGLASVRQIAAEHGGAVLVESREGQGSTFTLRLPMIGDAAG